MEGFIGEIKYFAGTFAPKNWVFCEGQQLNISQYSAVYSILGIQFGGDGKTYFKLPDLRGRMTIGTGQGSNLTNRTQGQTGGSETVQLTANSMPSHNHQMKCDVASPPPALKNTPANNLYGSKSSGTAYAPGTTTQSLMNQNMVDPAGQGVAHENMMPWQSLRYIICLYGYYPTRP